MDDQVQVPPILQLIPQLSPSSSRVKPGSVSSSSSSSLAVAAAAPAAAGPFETQGGKAHES